MGPSINDVMLFWGIFYPPPPHVMLFYASFHIVGSCGPEPPLPHDVIYGRPPMSVGCLVMLNVRQTLALGSLRTLGFFGSTRRSSRGGPPPPFFWGPLNNIMRDKTSSAFARMGRVLVLNSYADPPPPPFPISCFRPCAM